MSKKKQFISKKDEEEIIEAIRKAEKRTSGEIRVHLENKCPSDSIFERAKFIFHELKMDNTKQENGVLIYLAIEDHQFYIMGDKGIDKTVPDNFWEDTKDVMQAHFRKGQFKQGLVDGITLAGKELAAHFPWESDDENELSDEISRG